MRDIYDIYEGILDDDDVVTQKAEGAAIVSQLISNGIYYACAEVKARFASACENQLATFKDGNLCFFNDSAKVATEVVIDYDKAKNFLKRINLKSIEAPHVAIFNTGSDFSMFGTINTRLLKIATPDKTIKNLKVVRGRDWDSTVIKNADINYIRGGYDFCTSRMGIPEGCNTLMIDGYEKYTFQNSEIGLRFLSVRGEGVDFKNCKGELEEIKVYDPGLFYSECGKELIKLFDSNYKFAHYVNSNMKKERKTSSVQKIVAFFGNKKYFCPDSNPFKVIGKLKDICDVSGFKSLQVLEYQDNNYNIWLTKDKDAAQRWQRIDRFKYEDNYHHQFPLEQTTDGYYVIICSTK